jgi:hypothetical protein
VVEGVVVVLVEAMQLEVDVEVNMEITGTAVVATEMDVVKAVDEADTMEPRSQRMAMRNS